MAVRPRPRAAERPLRAERRRRPAEDFRPPPDGFIASRANQVLGESIDLLEQILDHEHGLLDAIADGTFGLMKRPADGGRGLDGVAGSLGYYNPASELLEGRSDERGLDELDQRGRAASRSGPTATRPATAWCRCPSPCRCRTRRPPRAPRSSSRTRWAWTRRWSCTPRPMGPDFTFFVVYGRVNHLVDLDKVDVVERDYPLLTPKEANPAIKRSAAPPAGRRGRLHRHRRPHRRHRRHPQHQGLRGREGAGVLPRDPRGQPRRAGLRAAARRPGARGEGRRRPGLPGHHPAGRPPAQHPGDVGRVPGGLPGRTSGRFSSSAAPASTSR